MGLFLQDLRFAIRWLKQSAGFSVVAILTLGLGIGANTAIFTIVNAVVLRQLPYQQSGQLVQMWECKSDKTASEIPVSGRNFADWQAQTKTFSQMAIFLDLPANVAYSGAALRVSRAWVSADFFKVLGVDAARGRVFSGADQEADVAVIGHELWRKLAHGDQEILGKVLRIDGKPYVIVGVLPEGLNFPDKTDVWALLRDYVKVGTRSSTNYEAIGRLRPGVSIQEANADMATVAASMATAFPDEMKGMGARVVSLHEQIVGSARRVLAIFSWAVAFVLLIACVNVANLLLARAHTRSREMAVRAALGASRWRLVRQLLTESLLLSVLGSVLGFLMLLAGFGLLKRFLPASLPRVDTVSVDWPVLGFTMLLTVLTSVVFGLLPSFHATRIDLSNTLKGADLSVARQRLGGWLVAGEVATALLLLVGAGLLIKSFWRLQNVDLGYDRENLLVAKLSLPTHGADSLAAQAAASHSYVRQIVEHVRSLPGVENAATVSQLLAGNDKMLGSGIPGAIEGRSQGNAQNPSFYVWKADYEVVSPGYFETVNARILRGRSFDDRDDENSPEVVVINEAAARQYWKNGDPIGQRVLFPLMSGTQSWATIVGIISDIHQQSLDAMPRPTVYTPHAQSVQHVWFATLVARVRDRGPGTIAAIQDQVRRVSSDVAVEVQPAESLVAESLSRQRFQKNVLMLFALMGLVLSAIGVFGVLSHMVQQRTREIGVRLALGAQKEEIVWLFLERGMRLCLMGLALGVAGSLALTRVLSAYLFGVKPTDPVVFSLTASLLFIVAVVATYLPARRATGVNPVDSLRAN